MSRASSAFPPLCYPPFCFPFGCRLLAGTLLICTAALSAQQLPAGTQEAPDPHAAALQNNAEAQEIGKAEAALEQHNFTSAEAILSTLATQRPNDAQVLYDLGFAQEGAGHTTAAASSYAASIAVNPSLSQPKVALGLLDARAGHAAEAHKLLAEASQLTSAPPALRGRALRALSSLDAPTNPNGARSELLNAIKLSGEQPGDLKATADLAAQQQDWPDAETAFRRLLVAHPDDTDAIATLGHVLQKQNKLAAADALLSAAAAQHPDNAALVAGLATVKVDEGKTADAIAAVTALRRLSPAAAADAPTTRLLARLDTLAGDNASAESLYTSLLASTPNDPALLDALGSAEVKQQKYAAADAHLTKAVALRSSFATPQDWAEACGHLAFAAYKNNQPEVALQALSERATVLPNSPASLFLEAIVHDSLHQTKEARRAYHAFLAVAAGKYPDQEFQARHRLITLEHMK